MKDDTGEVREIKTDLERKLLYLGKYNENEFYITVKNLKMSVKENIKNI